MDAGMVGFKARVTSSAVGVEVEAIKSEADKAVGGWYLRENKI